MGGSAWLTERLAKVRRDGYLVKVWHRRSATEFLALKDNQTSSNYVARDVNDETRPLLGAQPS